MKQFFTATLMGLGVIFLLFIIVVGYVVIADPWGLKPMFFGTSGSGTYQTDQGTNYETKVNATTTEGGTGFQLSAAQKSALQSFGIDPSKVPSSITAQQEACFTAALGAGRVAEIKGGAVPSAVEFFKAKGCI